MVPTSFRRGTRLKTVCHHFLDLKGAVSPLTLLRIIQVFREMKANETLELLGSDPETRTNIFKVLPSSSYHVISEEELAGDTPCFRILIRKERSVKFR
jgi:TusA-related sulfurtransferase